MPGDERSWARKAPEGGFSLGAWLLVARSWTVSPPPALAWSGVGKAIPAPAANLWSAHHRLGPMNSKCGRELFYSGALGLGAQEQGRGSGISRGSKCCLQLLVRGGDEGKPWEASEHPLGEGGP